MTYQKHLIQNLKNLAKSNKIKQIDIAKDVGLPKQNISWFFSGKSNPTLKTFETIANSINKLIKQNEKSI